MNVYLSVALRSLPLPWTCSCEWSHWNFDISHPSDDKFVAMVQGFLMGISSLFLIPTMHPWKLNVTSCLEFRNCATFLNFQYRQLRGHSIAIKTSFFINDMKCRKAAQSPWKILTCLLTLAAAEGCFRLTYDHDVPPVHGMLTQTSTSPSNSLTCRAISFRTLALRRSFLSVNCKMWQPFDSSRGSLSLDSSWQQTSTSKRLGFGPARSSLEQPGAAAAWLGPVVFRLHCSLGPWGWHGRETITPKQTSIFRN